MEISKSIYKLRERNRLSQSEFGALFHVSAQAVQKWEQGASTPSIANLVSIAKYFNVTIDALLLDSTDRIIEENKETKAIFPDYEGAHNWEIYSKNLMLEYQESTEAGCDLSVYQALFQAAAQLPESSEKEKIADTLFQIVINAPIREDFGGSEPDDLRAIRQLRGQESLHEKKPENSVMRKKLRGAWLGRIIGCLLGKPIEGIRTDELTVLLKKSGNYPMHRYIRSTDIDEEMCASFRFRLRGKCWADTVSSAPIDDDTNYTVLAQRLIEIYGRDFTPANVGALWLSSQPKDAYCTAERVAFRNLVAGYSPPNSARYKNPFREWIGAQIRGDYFGYINPGDPEAAAEMAWRDASISHVKNGIYGEMFVAAMIAAAAVLNDIPQIIHAGLGQIPADCRLSRSINSILENWKNGMSAQRCFAFIHSQYDEFDAHAWCHTISNAMIVAASLLYGGGDFGKSICLAVQTGFDTDCNGATVGSIVGMMGTDECISEEWKAPIHGMLDTSIFGVGMVSVDSLVEKTMEHLSCETEQPDSGS